MVEKMLKNFPRYFLNILSISIKMLKQWWVSSCKVVISQRLVIKLNLHGVTVTFDVTISGRSPEQDLIKNIFHIVQQSFCLEALDWNLFHWHEKLWNYYINQKKKGLNTGLFAHEKFFRRIEFWLQTKCSVIRYSYTLLFEECVMKAKRFLPGIIFLIFF